MKGNQIFVVVIIALVLFYINSGSSGSGGVSHVDPYQVYAAEGFFAAHVANKLDGSPTPNPTPRTCTECNGTGKVLSGDGISWVNCECGEECECKRSGVAGVDSCNCSTEGDCVCKTGACECTSSKGEPPAVIPRARRLLFFTMAACPPCAALKGETYTANGVVVDQKAPFPALQRAGWKIGASETSHIQVVEWERNPELWQKYGINAAPTFLLLDNGVVKKVISGAGIDQWDVGELLNGVSHRPVQQPLPTYPYPQVGWGGVGVANCGPTG